MSQQVDTISPAVREQPSLRPSPGVLQTVLADFGHELVMRASDECRVLPHILHLIGKGGEHMVFEDLRYPNYVLKVDFIESLPVLYAQARGEAAIVKAVGHLHALAEQHEVRIKRLQTYFLPGCVPIEIVTVKEVPLNEEVVLAILRDRNLEQPKRLVVPEKMPVLCTLQRRMELPDKKNRVNLFSSYAELNRTIKLDYYAEGHRLLSTAKNIGPVEASAREKIIAYIYPSLKSVIGSLHTDDRLIRALADYVRRAMRYSVETNEIIDMAGGGNVMFLPDPALGWQCFLMDALSPPELNFHLIKQAGLMIKHDQALDIRMRANTLNVINYIRFTNALAMLAGIPDRLAVDGMDIVSPEQWHAGLMIEKYLDVYSPKVQISATRQDD